MAETLRTSATNTGDATHRGGSSLRRDATGVPLLVLALVATAVLTNQVWRDADWDIGLYRSYAEAFWTQHPRFSVLPPEYPPLALVPFSLPLIVSPGAATLVFEVAMGALVLAGYLGIARVVDRRRALLFAVYLLVGAQGFLLSRYDLVPSMLVLGTLWAARARRFGLAYTLLAFATLLKLYPLVLLPVLLIAQWHAEAAYPHFRRRVALGAALYVGLMALGLALPAVRNPAGALSALRTASSRPVQVESVPATLVWLGSLVGIPAQPTYAFGSDVWIGPLAQALATLSPLPLVAGCFAVYGLHAKGRLSTERAFLTCLCILLVTAKVFSTQYVIWVLPLAAMDGELVFAWLAVCALTFLDYPLLYPFNVPGYTQADVALFMLALLARNGLLLWITWRLLRSTSAQRQHTDAAGSFTMPAAARSASVFKRA